MAFSLRTILFLLIGALLGAAQMTQTANSTPPVAVPAFLDVVTFAFNAEGENHKVVVTSGPNLLRVDEPADGYSVIYHAQTDSYTGLEHRNYTYWEFSWPEVRDAVENSKRHEERIQELNNLGLSEERATASTSGTDAGASAGGDDSGYVWHPTTDRKRIADLDCARWTGDTVSGENVEAWCYAGPLPKVQAAVERLRAINDPMALVPVREIVPDFIFPVYAALVKGGVTPVQINWGDEQEKNHFQFVEAATRDGKLSLFTVPKLYIKTTLVTMDGMVKEQPVPVPPKTTPAKTWQN